MDERDFIDRANRCAASGVDMGVDAISTSAVPARGAGAPEDSSARAFEIWVSRHWAAMARLARRLCSDSDWEDSLQEALTAAWRKRRQYDPSRGSPLNWLLAIVADQVLKARRRSQRPVGVRDVPVEPGPTGEGVDIERALARLTGRQAVVVALYYFLDQPVGDIAQVLRCSPGTVKSTLSDARGRLRAELGADYR